MGGVEALSAQPAAAGLGYGWGRAGAMGRRRTGQLACRGHPAPLNPGHALRGWGHSPTRGKGGARGQVAGLGLATQRGAQGGWCEAPWYAWFTDA